MANFLYDLKNPKNIADAEKWWINLPQYWQNIFYNQKQRLRQYEPLGTHIFDNSAANLIAQIHDIDCKGAAFNLDDFTGLPNLEKFNVSNCIGVTNCFSKCNFTKLKDLTCNGSDLDLEKIPELPSIEKLYIQKCSGTTKYLNNHHLANLRILDCSETDLEKFSPLAGLTYNLENFSTENCIRLQNIDLSDALSLKILNVSGCINLTTLNLLNCSNLKELDLSGCTSLTFPNLNLPTHNFSVRCNNNPSLLAKLKQVKNITIIP